MRNDSLVLKEYSNVHRPDFRSVSKFYLVFLMLVSWQILCADVQGQGETQKAEGKTPKVGLVLSGGGARGSAHIGVLFALEENNIPIDLIAGTSMGSIVGGLYAAGYGADALRRLVKQIDWVAIFSQKPVPTAMWVSKRYGLMEPILRVHFKFWDIFIPYGLDNGQRISEELFRLAAAPNFAAKENFDSLAIPYRAIAVDVSTGNREVLGQGSLAQAMRSSMAIPLLFYPALFQDKLMVDGGVLDVLPTDVAKQMGADVIIAVDVAEMFPQGKEPSNIVDVANHTIDIMIKALEKPNLALADVLIKPDLGQHSSTNYSRLDSLIDIGYKATMEKMPEIISLLQRKGIMRPMPRHYLDNSELGKSTITEIAVVGHRISDLSMITPKKNKARLEVINQKSVPAQTILGDFPLKKGDRFNIRLAQQGLEYLYATGLFQNVWLEVKNAGEERVAVNIHYIEKYPRIIGLGANYINEEGFSAFIQIVPFNIFGWSYQLMPLFRYGEIATQAGVEISNNRFFSTPFIFNSGAYYEDRRPLLYDADGRKTGNLDLNRVVGQFSLGLQPYRKFLFTAGLRGQRGWLGEVVRDRLPAETFQYWSLFTQALFDNRNARYFPTHGVYLSLQAEHVPDVGQRNIRFTKFEGSFQATGLAWKDHIFTVYSQVGLTGSKLPVYEEFRLGGPLGLPGYHRDEVWGNNLLELGIWYRWNFYRHFNWQIAWSAANIFPKQREFSLRGLITGVSTGLAVSSPVGPLHFMYGWSRTERSQLYISVGYIF